MLEKLRNRKFIPIVSIGLLVLVFLFIFYFFKSGDDRFVTGIGEGPDSGTPKAFSEKSNDTKDATDSIKSDNTPADLDLRIRESYDREALGNVRRVGTSVVFCITRELDLDRSESDIYSVHGGCADKNYLISKEYGSAEQLTSDIVLLTDKQQTRVCVYSLNDNGNGVVSFSSEKGLVTNAGEGKLEC